MNIKTGELIERLKGLGYRLHLDGDRVKFRYTGVGEPPAEAKALIDELKGKKAEAMDYLKEQRPKPYFDLDGSLVIPFASDPRFHYWNGGQSIKTTEKEVRSWKE